MKKLISVAVVLLSIFALSVFFNKRQADAELANQSCKAVNHILSEQFNMDNVSCEKVEIQQKVSEDFYQGKAYLSTGKVSDIGIKDKGGKILVTMVKD